MEDEKTYNPSSLEIYEEQFGLKRKYKIINLALKIMVENIENMYEG